MHVGMYACMHVCMYVCMYIYIYTCTYDIFMYDTVGKLIMMIMTTKYNSEIKRIMKRHSFGLYANRKGS